MNGRDWIICFNWKTVACLRAWLFFDLAIECEKRDVRHFDHFETNAGNIADGVTGTTKTSDQHFVLLYANAWVWIDDLCKRTSKICTTTNTIHYKYKQLTFSSIKLRQPSFGTNAAIFLPFLINCTRTHLRMAELGCLASMPLYIESTCQ